jgi:hypothetical protein
MCIRAWIGGRGLPELHRSTPCRLGAFNEVGGRSCLTLSGRPNNAVPSPTMSVCHVSEFVTYAEPSDLVNPVMALSLRRS